MFRLMFFTSLELNLLSLPNENNLKRVIPPTWGWTVITIATIALELSEHPEDLMSIICNRIFLIQKSR